LLLVLPHDRTAALRERLPVHGSYVVADDVLAQRLELGQPSAPARVAHAQIAPALARGESQRLLEAEHRRLDRERLRTVHARLAFDEAESTAQSQPHVAEARDAAPP